ncbi:DUF6689 family protein [Lysobacter koreensis]|uniref:DUF6689 family protein n=1 Tax=Lysobacter koreensis TaxID=266122 RepID=A0ABW2YPR0_9GAMM
MIRFALASKLLLAGLLSVASGWAAAQSLPVMVTTAGDDASIVIGNPLTPLADVTLSFEDASGLSAASLGVSAEQVSLTDPTLLARLPDLNLTAINSALPLLITIEPPVSGGLAFRDTGRIEVHTHALAYTLGSSFRLLKAPLGGKFRDVTDEVAQGSVRARGTYGGFSQFLIVADLRPTGSVIDEKLAYLRGRIAALPFSERQPFTAKLDAAEAAVDQGAFASALAEIDAFRARAQARAGSHLANEWRATRNVDNQSGELEAGAATLRFSVAYLRDFGQ